MFAILLIVSALLAHASRARECGFIRVTNSSISAVIVKLRIYSDSSIINIINAQIFQ